MPGTAATQGTFVTNRQTSPQRSGAAGGVAHLASNPQGGPLSQSQSPARESHSTQQASQQTVPSGASSPSNELFVLLCTQSSWGSRLWHAQIELAPSTSDDGFFNQLRTKYIQLRGIRYWLDPLQYDHCEFVKYSKFYVDELARVGQDLPLDATYIYKPRPPG